MDLIKTKQSLSTIVIAVIVTQISSLISLSIIANDEINRLFIIIIVISTGFYIYGLDGFSKQLDKIGSDSVKILLIAGVISLPSYFISGNLILLLILGIIVTVLELIGFYQFKFSKSLNAAAISGVNLLLIASVISLTSCIVIFISLLGVAIALLLIIGASILTIIGWINIQSSFNRYVHETPGNDDSYL